MSDAPSDSSGGDARQDAEQLYVEFLGSDEASLTDGFERLARRHPELENELRSLHADFEDLERVLDDAAASPEFPFEELSRLHARGGHKRYRIEGEIARGGQGAVMRIWDGDLKRHLAMKLTLGRVASSTAAGDSPTPASSTPPLDSRTIHRFLNEAKITGQLDHPGIVPIHELGVDDDGQAYFTMKLVNGHSLHEIFHRHRKGDPEWSTQRCVGLILKATEAVAYAHSKGIIHRDLKPANIMVGEYGEVYVMDWGMARDLARTESDGESSEDPGENGSPLTTQQGAVLGTLSYMPPEQAKGDVSRVSPSSDVYSLGAVLYALLAKRPPFVLGDDHDHTELLNRVQNEAPPSIESNNDDPSGELASIVGKAMSRSQNKRYPTASELMEDIRAHLDGRVVKAHATGVYVELRKWVARNRLVSCLAVLALIASLLWGRSAVESSRERARSMRERIAFLQKRSDLWLLRECVERIDSPIIMDPEELESMREMREFVADLPSSLSITKQLVAETARRELESRPDSPARPFIVGIDNLLADAENELGEGDQSLLRQARKLFVRHDARTRYPLPALESRGELTGRSEFRSDVDWNEEFMSLLAPLLCQESGWWSLYLKRLQLLESLAPYSPSALWREVLDDIAASEASNYDYFGVEPQWDLVPLRKDPQSGLWEFAHLLSGEPPVVGPDGAYIIDEETSLVFVLFPGGEGLLGAQGLDAAVDRYDQEARAEEFPPIAVGSLDPYFLSKYEMTQGQWIRLTGDQPCEFWSGYSVEGQQRVSRVHPVESVSHLDASRWLGSWSLDLPTEAQWELACSLQEDGGSDLIVDSSQLSGALQHGGAGLERIRQGLEVSPGLELDGWIFHAPVDEVSITPSGLYGMHGNVREHCLDLACESYSEDHVLSVRIENGLITPRLSMHHSVRGGGFYFSLRNCRQTIRTRVLPGEARSDLGVRPCRTAVMRP